jgi:hypothetical protein
LHDAAKNIRKSPGGKGLRTAALVLDLINCDPLAKRALNSAMNDYLFNMELLRVPLK